MNLRRAETVDVDLRKMPFDIGQQFFVPLDFEFRMQSALHQNLIAAEVHGLANFFQQLGPIEHVTFGMFRADGKTHRNRRPRCRRSCN